MVLSEFSRMENECITILDLWLPTTYAKLENARSPLEQSVLFLFFIINFNYYFLGYYYYLL